MADPNKPWLWQKGQSGNPRGRRAELAVARQLLNSKAPELVQKAIDMALADDPAALRLCVERILPARKRFAVIEHPEVEAQLAAGADLDAIGRAVMRAVARGELDPDDAFAILEMLDVRKRLSAKSVELLPEFDGDPGAKLRELAALVGYEVVPRVNAGDNGTGR